MSVFVIGEIGVNHQGRLDHALELIKHAAGAGCDAVKFQGFSPTVQAPDDYATRAMLKGLWLSPEEIRSCADECKRQGIEFMLTPMTMSWLETALSLNVKRIKVGSGQNRDLAFLRAIGECGLPVILSCGMGMTDVDLAAAYNALLAKQFIPVTLLACQSKYPTPDADVTMEGIAHLKRRMGAGPGIEYGFSCHARSMWPSIAAVYAGATVVEKHIALPDTTGPDISSSLLVSELPAWVREIRAAERARGV